MQVVIFREVVIEHGCIQILILRKRIDSIVTFGDNVVVQPFFEVACAISLLLASHEVITVIIHILLDKSVNEFCLTAKFNILNHCVDDVLALLGIILTVWIKVCNQLQYIGNIDDVAMQKFQAEIDVSQPCSVILTRVRLGNHTRFVILNFMTAWLFCRFRCKGVVYVKILAAEVHKLLFGHAKVIGFLLKLIINLYLSVLLDDVTESKYKLLLIVLALKVVHEVRLGIMLQEVLSKFLIVTLHLIEGLAHNIFKIIAVAEKFDRLVHLAFQVAEANHLTETLLLIQHTVGTAESL